MLQSNCNVGFQDCITKRNIIIYSHIIYLTSFQNPKLKWLDWKTKQKKTLKKTALCPMQYNLLME